MRAKLALILFLSVAVLNAGGKRKFAAGQGLEGGSVAISNGCASSAKPFYFSADVAEGNHLVTVTLGAQVGGPSETTIKAELRRLMAESIRVEAGQRNVPLIDLHAMSAKVYEAFGPEPSVQLFSSARDGTHHNNYGSYQLAKCIVEAIRVAHLPLAKHLIEVTPYDPVHPDAIEAFHLPPSPSLKAATPDGN